MECIHSIPFTTVSAVKGVEGVWKSSHQSNQIPGVLAAEVTTAAEDNQRHEEDCVGHVVRPRILTHK